MKIFKFLLLFATFQLSAQTAGYYGNKLFIDLGAHARVPILSNLLLKNRAYGTNSLSTNKTYDLQETGVRISIGRIASENAGGAFELGINNYFINPAKLGEINRNYLVNGLATQEYLQVKNTYLAVQELNFGVKSVFSVNNSLIPSGIMHEFGYSFSNIQLKPDNFDLDVPNYTEEQINSIKSKFIDQRIESYSGMRVFYGIRSNLPLTKGILFSWGARYDYGFMFGKKKARAEEYSEFYFDTREQWSRLNQRRKYGLLSAQIGLILAF